MRHNSQRPRDHTSVRRSKREILILCISFAVGLLLVALPLKLLSGVAAAQSDLVAPVFLPPQPAIWPREKRPVPVNDQVGVPAELNICISMGGAFYDLFGKVKDKDNTYYLLGIDWNRSAPFDPLNVTDELIETNDQVGCERLGEDDTARQPFTAYMSESAAQALELQRYRKLVADEGGVAQLQQALRGHLEPGASYLFTPEQVHALQQLHVALPPHQPF